MNELDLLKEARQLRSRLATSTRERAKETREALRALVHHDRAANIREGLDGCVELQWAEEVLATPTPEGDPAGETENSDPNH